MPLFVIFVVASIILGAGAMLAPALPTRGPRIALAGTLTLAFITSGSIVYACLFGWDTLVIDYLWFAALVGIFFTGTLSAGMFRAEAEGGIREYGGWPVGRELLFFGLVALIFIAPSLVLPVPLDTDAQGFGYLALTLREGGSLTTLAPFHPEITFLYSPGFPALVAYLSERLFAGIQIIQIGIGAVLGLLFVWLAYDFGVELADVDHTGHDESHNPRLSGLVFAFAALIGLGLYMAYMDSHFTAMLGLCFTLAFATFILRFQREGRRADFWGAAITLAALPLAQPDMTIVAGLGYGALLVLVWFSRPRPTLREFGRRWLVMAFGIPLVAVAGVSPWIIKILPLLQSDIGSPFAISISHLIVATVYHGVVIALVALAGLVIAARRRTPADLMMIGWLALVIDFSSIGVVKAIWPGMPLFKYDYPFSIAWHGPIIPYLYLAGSAMLWLLQRRDGLRRWLSRAALPLMGAAALVVVLAVIFAQPLLIASKSTPFMMYGAFSSQADVEAMRWIGENTPRDALILNHPGDQEGDWVPVIAQRDTVYFRPQPFFHNTEKVEAMQQDLRAFWRDPTNAENAALLARYGVDYVIQPQIFAEPDRLREMFRWRPPMPVASVYGVVNAAPFLELVFEKDGARVYRVINVG